MLTALTIFFTMFRKDMALSHPHVMERYPVFTIDLIAGYSMHRLLDLLRV
jgi:hypothetical protein